MKRKIAVVTGTRAEYGLLYWTMKSIQQSEELQLQLVVTGAHLSPQYGSTYKLIEEDGFIIDKKVDLLVSNDTPVAVSKSMGLGMIGFAQAYEELNPDILVVLGDRYEILAAVSSVISFNIPIAHIHGGEVTEGSIDEQIRHAITKMSHFHFASTEIYAKNIVNMGEEEWRVHNAGAAGLEWLIRGNWISKEDLAMDLGIDFNDEVILSTFHPVTLQREATEKIIENLIDALVKIDKHVIFTSANSDTNGMIINQKIKDISDSNPKIRFINSLGQRRYLACLKHCALMVGNSSSGIIEAASFRLPVVNIGNRQKGRIRGVNVIDTGNSLEDIISGINKALSSDFKESIKNIENPYQGEGLFSEYITNYLKNVELGQKALFKKLLFNAK